MQRAIPPAAEAGAPARVPLGPLELRVLEVLWTHKHPTTVRIMQTCIPELAYTTLMTTLDRLYRKGMLLRLRRGRAFAYEPRGSRDELFGEIVSGHVIDLLGAFGTSTSILSTLVKSVGRADVNLLDELDHLVQTERMRLRRDIK
jgi:predicted transcriptional regulator